MSGFFGIFKPGGDGIDLDQFEQMKNAVHQDGYDGLETFVDDHFAVGHLMLRVGNAAEYDRQPLLSDCKNYVLAGHFRLDYRDELGDKLGLTQAELKVTPDSLLAMMAYKKWKDKCVLHLEGDWAFIVYSKEVVSVSLYRSATGNCGLFFTELNGCLYFSDEISLFSIFLGKEIDIDSYQVSRLLINKLRIEIGKTLFKSVNELIAGECLFYSLGKYERFDWSEKIFDQPEVNFKDENDLFFEFESALYLSVRSKLSASVKSGVLLSSGSDSTCITYYLSKELEYKKDSLWAYTLAPIYTYDTEIPGIKKNDESIIANSFTKQFTNIIHHTINCSNYSFGQLFRSHERLDFLNPKISAHELWLDKMIKQAKDDSLKIILNAQLGNITLSYCPTNIVLHDLIHFKWKKAFHNLNQFKEKYSKSLRFTLSYFIKRPLASWLRMIYYSFFSLYILYEKTGNKTLDLLVFKKFEKRRIKSEDIIVGISFFLSSKKFRLKYSKYNQVLITGSWYQKSKESAILMLDPTADIRFQKFSFSVPEYYFFKNGNLKYMLSSILKMKFEFSVINQNEKRYQMRDLPFLISNDSSIGILLSEFSKPLHVFNSSHNSQIGINLVQMYKKMKSETDIEKKYELGYKFIENLSLFRFLRKVL